MENIMKEKSQPDIVAHGRSDVGKKRDHNEDNYELYTPEDPSIQATKGQLFAVADGMGGHLAGEVASELALQALRDTYYATPAGNPLTALQQAVEAANAQVHQQAQATQGQQGMGTTLTALVIQGNQAHIAHVGDSRAYRLRNGALEQLTLDHSWAAEGLRRGMLTPEQAANHPHKNVLLRSIGKDSTVEVDTRTEQIQPGDVFLLCSDGLTNEVFDDKIARVLSQSPPSTACKQLIKQANRHGGKDNITAVVMSAGRKYPTHLRKWGLLGGSALAIVLLLIAFVWMLLRQSNLMNIV